MSIVGELLLVEQTPPPDYYGTAIYGTSTYNNIPFVVLPANTVAPVASGSVLVGSSLSCTSGTWADLGHISYAYQWQSSPDGATLWGSITGATSSTYTLQAGDASRFLRCVVTDTDSRGSSAASSNTVGAVAWPAPTNTAAPVISGTAQVGSILASTTGTWTDDGSAIFAYSWQSSPNGSTGWSAISSGALYLIEESRRNQYLLCVVTSTDSGGTSSVSSNVLGPVTEPAIVGLPLTVHTSGTLTLTPDTPND